MRSTIEPGSPVARSRCLPTLEPRAQLYLDLRIFRHLFGVTDIHRLCTEAPLIIRLQSSRSSEHKDINCEHACVWLCLPDVCSCKNGTGETLDSLISYFDVVCEECFFLHLTRTLSRIYHGIMVAPLFSEIHKTTGHSNVIIRLSPLCSFFVCLFYFFFYIICSLVVMQLIVVAECGRPVHMGFSFAVFLPPCRWQCFLTVGVSSSPTQSCSQVPSPVGFLVDGTT